MSTNDNNIHLLPANDYNHFDNSSNELEDDSTEVVFSVDEKENQITAMTEYSAFTRTSDSYYIMKINQKHDENWNSHFFPKISDKWQFTRPTQI